jgi:hypothetical protein
VDQSPSELVHREKQIFLHKKIRRRRGKREEREKERERQAHKTSAHKEVGT